MSVANIISLAAQFEELASPYRDDKLLENKKYIKLEQVKFAVEEVCIAAKKLEQQYNKLLHTKKGPVSGFLEKHLDSNHIGTMHALSEVKKKLENIVASLEQSKVPILGKL